MGALADDDVRTFQTGTSCIGRPIPIFMPGSKFMTYWIVLGVVMVLYELYMTPYRLCFDHPATDLPFRVWEFLINCYFICDFCINFVTAYEDEMGELITRQKQIVLQYLKTWMIFDFIASVPVDWILWALDAREDGKNWGSTKMFRMLRILRFVRMVRIAKMTRYAHLVDQFEQTLEEPLTLFFWHILQLLFVLAMVAHLCGCFWFLVGTQSGPVYPDPDGNPVSWNVPGVNIPDYVVDPWYKWAWSIYYAMVTMTTVGYGDITPTNNAEIIYTFFLLWVSMIVFSGCLGILMNHVTSLYEESQKRRAKMTALVQYLNWRTVPLYLRRQIRKYMSYVWQNNQNFAETEGEVIRALSPHMQGELCFKIFGRILTTAPFLSWLDGSPTALRKLTLVARTVFCEAKDLLFEEGEVKLTIFFLLDGWVRVSTGVHNLTLDELEYSMPEDKLLTESKKVNEIESLMDTFSVLRKVVNVGTKKKTHEHKAYRDASADAFKTVTDAKMYEVARERMNEIPVPRNSQSASSAEDVKSFIPSPAFFGESTLWMTNGDETPMQYTARCFTRVEIVQLDKSDIMDVANTYPHIKSRFDAFVQGVVSEMEESMHYRDSRPSAILERSSTSFARAITGGAIKGDSGGSPIKETQLLKPNGRSPKSNLPLDDDGYDTP